MEYAAVKLFTWAVFTQRGAPFWLSVGVYEPFAGATIGPAAAAAGAATPLTVMGCPPEPVPEARHPPVKIRLGLTKVDQLLQGGPWGPTVLLVAIAIPLLPEGAK